MLRFFRKQTGTPFWGRNLVTRKDRAKRLLEETLAGLGNPDVPTMTLLYKCQEISRLLELGEEATWIDSELIGYPPFDLGSSSSEKDITFPRYRVLNLPATATTPVESLIPNRVDFQKIPMTAPFYVSFACGILETARSPVTLSFDMLFKTPSDERDYRFSGPKQIPARFNAQLSVDAMRGIVFSIRGRVGTFAAAHYSALSFENSASNIMDATRNLLADRLQKLHPPTLDLINETLDKQQKSTDPLEWRDVLENTRTILRRITGVLIKKPILPDGASVPEEGETNKKTTLILDWVRTRLGKEYDKEIKYVDSFLSTLAIQQDALIGLINKPIHKEVTYVTRGDVDRIVLATLLWIADLTAILDKAGYDWSSVHV